MIIELSNAKVTLKDRLNYGETEDIQMIMAGDTKFSAASGEIKESTTDISIAKMKEVQYKILEVAVIEIEQTIDGITKKLTYSKDWVRNLEVDDATELLTKATELLSKKK